MSNTCKKIAIRIVNFYFLQVKKCIRRQMCVFVFAAEKKVIHFKCDCPLYRIFFFNNCCIFSANNTKFIFFSIFFNAKFAQNFNFLFTDLFDFIQYILKILKTNIHYQIRYQRHSKIDEMKQIYLYILYFIVFHVL